MVNILEVFQRARAMQLGCQVSHNPVRQAMNRVVVLAAVPRQTEKDDWKNGQYYIKYNRGEGAYLCYYRRSDRRRAHFRHALSYAA